MQASHVILVFASLLLFAVLTEPLARRIHLPFCAVLVLAGYLTSEAVVALGFDTGVRWYNFNDIIFYVLIPLLVFESAFKLDLGGLLAELPAILVLAIPAVLASAVIMGALLYFCIGHATGFPWTVALLTGVLLSATDPAAVIALCREMPGCERLGLMLEGESLFNDATAIVLFGLVTSLALMPAERISWSATIMSFAVVFVGGLLVGILFGTLAYALIRILRQPLAGALISLAIAYGAFLAAEELLHYSGVMAVLGAGITLGGLHRHAAYLSGRDFTLRLWEFNGYAANASIFLLAGVTITLAMFEDQWLAMLIGIGAATLARAASVFASLGLTNLLPGSKPISAKLQTAIAWGGVRGAVTLALALSLPRELDAWYTVQSIAYGVVVFALFIQAPAMPWLLRRLSVR